jgi:hypothetical protein
VVRVIIVRTVGGLVRKLHGKAKSIIILGAYLAKLLKLLNPGNGVQNIGGLEKSGLGGRPLGVLQTENNGVANHLYLHVFHSNNTNTCLRAKRNQTKLPCMFAILRTGSIYFAMTFAAAFVLGVFRALFVAPALGELLAVVLELVPMIILSWFTCGFALRRWPIPATLPARASMGATAFILLMLAEAALSLTLGGLSLRQHAELFTTAPVLLGLAGQLLFAVFPMVRR